MAAAAENHQRKQWKHQHGVASKRNLALNIIKAKKIGVSAKAAAKNNHHGGGAISSISGENEIKKKTEKQMRHGGV